jgi:hypothetical protein
MWYWRLVSEHRGSTFLETAVNAVYAARAILETILRLGSEAPTLHLEV